MSSRALWSVSRDLKRWQRRWFVLYDDGELTYSVDDLPATIPQGVIDMNRVLEVSGAEDVTGNQFSLAITSPDRVTFVKGTSREESRWWQDVLSVFPRMHKHGRHKRNATFPGIKGSSAPASSAAAHPAARSGAAGRVPSTLESPVSQRVRFHSISSDLRGNRRPCSAPSLDTQQSLFTHQQQFSGNRNSSGRQYDSVTESSNGSDNSNEDDDGLSSTKNIDNDDDIEKKNQINSYYSSRLPGSPTSHTIGNDSAGNGLGNNISSIVSSTVTPFNSLHHSRSNPIPTPSQTPSPRVGMTTSTAPISPTILPSTPPRLVPDDHKENTPPYVPAYSDNPPTSESPPTQDKQTHRLRTRRALNREARALSQPGSRETSSTHGMTSVALVRSAYVASQLHKRLPSGIDRYRSLPCTTSRDSDSSNMFTNSDLRTNPFVDFRSRALSIPIQSDFGSSPATVEPDGTKRLADESFKNVCKAPLDSPVLGSSYTPVYQPRTCMPLKSILKKSASASSFATYRPRCDSGSSNTFPSLDGASSSTDDNQVFDSKPKTTFFPSTASSYVKYSPVPDILKDSMSLKPSSAKPKPENENLRRCDITLERTHSSSPSSDAFDFKTESSRGRSTSSSTYLHGELETSTALADLEASKREAKLKDIAASITTTSSRRRQYHHLHHQQSNVADKPTRDRDTDVLNTNSDPTDIPPSQMRGAPDGCGGTDEGGSVSLPRVDLPAEDLLFIKKGWLLKAGDNQEWNKYWFVLQGAGLRFYRNSSAEDNGILDGIIDMATAEDIHNVDVARNYGFVIKTWSEKQFVFSAVTAGIRNNWVTALRNAAGLKAVKTTLEKEALQKTATIESIAAERDNSTVNKSLLSNNKKNASQLNNSGSKLESFSTPNGAPKSNFSSSEADICKPFDGIKDEDVGEIRSPSRVALSSDDEYKTASETSGVSNVSNENAEFFDWDGSRLPHSTSSPVRKPRSQSSPPNSRRTTADTFPTSESPFGLGRNLLDRYRDMQNLTVKQNIPKTSISDEVDSQSPCGRGIDGHPCAAQSTCAKLSNLPTGVSSLKLSDSLRSLDLEGSINHEKVSSSGTLASGSGDALLVDLLETQVETLKAKLEATQADLLELHKEHVALHQRVTVAPYSRGCHGALLTAPQIAPSNAEESPPESLQELESVRSKLMAAEANLAETLEQLSELQNLNLDYEIQLQELRDGNQVVRNECDEFKEEAIRCRKQVEEHCATILQLQACVDESDDLLSQFRHQIEVRDKELDALRLEFLDAQAFFNEKETALDEIQRKFVSENLILKEKLEVTEHMLLEEEQRNARLEEATLVADEDNTIARSQMEEVLTRADFLQGEVDRLVEQVNIKDRQLVEQANVLRELQSKHEQEKAAWREAAEGGNGHLDTVRQLKSSLEESERRVTALRARLDDRDVTDGLREHKTPASLQTDNSALLAQLNDCKNEIVQLKESIKCEKSEVYKWKDLVKELRSLLDGRNIDMDRKREEIRQARESLRISQQEHEVTRDRLQRGIEENEALSAKLRELQRQLTPHDKRTCSVTSVYSSREKFSSRRHLPLFDSLSDLSNVDFSLDPEAMDRETLNDEFCNVRSRLELSLSEIRALRRELRESQSEHDALQLTHIQLGQDCAKQRQDAEAQLALMTERVQDLTNKLSNSEKQVRQMKTKMTRAESRDRRRTQSLRGKDAAGVGRDVDAKLCQLEARIDQLMPTIETADRPQSSIPSMEDARLSESQRLSLHSKSGRTTKRSKSFDDPTKASRLRRKSLESSAAAGDGVTAALRITKLESKVAALTPARSSSPSRTGSPADCPSLGGRSKLRSSGERYSRSRRGGAEVEPNLSMETPGDVLPSLSMQLGECVELLDAYRCSCGRSDLSFLRHRLTAAYRTVAVDMPLPPAPAPLSQASEKLLPVVQQVVLLLQQKLSSLNERRNNLKNSNSWTKEAQLKNFAERIAYETVLLGQVLQALRICNQSHCNSESVKLQDLMESHRKIAFLEKKLTNPEFDLDTMAPLEFYTSMLAEKLVVTGEVLSSVNTPDSQEQNPVLSATCRDLQLRLLERERQLAQLILNYKEEKLHEIAVVMTQEQRCSAPLDESILLEEVRMREAWGRAHRLLVQELISHQTSQSLFRMTHMLNLNDETVCSAPTASSLSLTLCSAEAIDRLQAAAEESLKQEMEESVLTLSQKYEEILAQQRAGDTSLINSVSASMEEVLNEFAGIMAQKALIDGHLALLQEEFDKGSLPTAQNSLQISEDNKDPIESAVDVLDSEAHLLMFLGGKDSSVESLVKPALSHAEFTFLYNKGVQQGNEDAVQVLSQILLKKPEVSEVRALASSSSYRSSSLSLQQASPVASDRDLDVIEQPRLRTAISMSKINPSPKSRRKHETKKSRRSSDITGMTVPGCKMCEELRHELAKLKKKHQTQESKCDNCPKLLDTIERLEAAQRARVELLTPTDSDQTLAEMENRIMVLEAAYEAKIAALELQYKQALDNHPDSGDDTIRKRYQKEIIELRGLCEKGLGTMEISTQRIVAEIKEKHRQELSLLQAEKEQALAEETHATLAALDAMRKAHEAEVQREVAKMREEFISKMQAGQDFGEMSQRHETEMRDIRREILSLSEKYSVKCLESADLETKVDNLVKQLNEACKTIADLESRNTKLKAQLTEKISSLKATTTPGDTESELRLRVAEASLKDDKLAKMEAELQRVQSHEGEVLEVCRHLRHFLRSDRPIMATDQLSAVTDRLEHLMLTASTALRDNTEGLKQPRQTRPSLRRPKVYSSKELTRSPSCPRLGAHPPRLSCPTTAMDDLLHCYPLPNSPLSGMVASRKKVFENTDSNSSKA
ncbi:uncharacterized protein LOC108667928 [Hyalella azteca]|uniref:Uncharacterized protein LOC108667928 n=1 Tax=Hyalella azteca TaxID=294128 RepID=A0A979FSE0_HYAAZ|nr:uncharacterized protein LOC108667928 [Hyalella azteca]